MNAKIKTITLLIGLPGSGKSYWLKNNVNKHNSFVFDDISQTDPQLTKLTTIITQDKFQHIYIADVNFLQNGTIEKAQQKIRDFFLQDIEFHYIIFVGSKDNCTKNVMLRNDGRKVNGTIERFAKSVIPIYNQFKDYSNTIIINVEDYSLTNKNEQLPKKRYKK